MFAVLVLGLLLTLAVAIVGWFRPLPAKPPSAPVYSSQQIADAKAKVCAEYQKVHSAIDVYKRQEVLAGVGAGCVEDSGVFEDCRVAVGPA